MIKEFLTTYLFVLSFLLLSTSVLQAQLISSTPAFPLVNESVLIQFNASEGSAGLAGYTGDVYAHTGVITENSTSGSDWKYVKTNWGQNTPDTKLTRVSGDIYTLEIDPDIQSYYGVPEGEKILQMAFVFRSGTPVNGSYLEGKTSTFGDIFLDVYETATTLQGQRILPSTKNTIVPGGGVIPVEVSFSKNCDISVYDNGIWQTTLSDASMYEENIFVSDDNAHKIDIIGVADNDSAIVSFSYLRERDADTESLLSPFQLGANSLDDHTMRLILDAPNKSNVLVHTNVDDFYLNEERWMKKSDDGRYFWVDIDISSLQGEPLLYNYIVDKNIVIADPFAEVVLDKIHDGFIDSLLFPDLPAFPANAMGTTVTYVDDFDYTFQLDDYTRPANKDLVIYEVLLRDFLGSHSYQDLIDTVPYFEKLGVNAIELMPINEFEGNISWGYNPSFHGAVDKYYGDPKKLKEFIDRCHEYDIAVILDVVFNHVFSQSPLAQLYWNASSFQPAADNPWLNVEAKHPFNVGYDVNHQYIGTQDWVDQILKRWLEQYKFDGFRFDLSKGFTQVNSGGNVSQWGQYDASRIALLKRIADRIWSVDENAYVILEHFAANSEEKELAEYGMMLWGNMTSAYGEAAMGYHDNNKSNLQGALHTQRGWQEPHLIAYMESHDEERMMYKLQEFGNSSGDYNTKAATTSLERIALASAFFYTLPGPKMLWQFGEMGYPFSINRCTDGSINGNCRLDPKPIRWDFLDESDRKELFTDVSDIIHLKTSTDLFNTATLNYSLANAYKWLKYSSTDENAVIIGNFDVIQQSEFILFPATGMYYDFISGDSIQIDDVAQTISLAPGEYRMYFDKKKTRYSQGGMSSIRVIEQLASTFMIHPNPIHSGDITVSSTAIPMSSIAVYDMAGRRVFGKQLAGTERTSFSSEALPTSGQYVLFIETEQGMVPKLINKITID